MLLVGQTIGLLSHVTINREGPWRSLSLPEKEAREPKTYILLAVGQAIGLLSHMTHDRAVQWLGRQLTNGSLYFDGKVSKIGKTEIEIVGSSDILTNQTAEMFYYLQVGVPVDPLAFGQTKKAAGQI